MAFRNLLRSRADIYRPSVDLTTGSAKTSYQLVYSNVKCNLDLQFIRKGRDPVWTPEATTTPQLRQGVGFFLRRQDIQDGDRVFMHEIDGGEDSGMFEVARGVDKPKRPGKVHHIEVWLSEIAPQIANP